MKITLERYNRLKQSSDYRRKFGTKKAASLLGVNERTLRQHDYEFKALNAIPELDIETAEEVVGQSQQELDLDDENNDCSEAELDRIAALCNVSPETVKYAWVKTEEFSAFLSRGVQETDSEGKSYFDIRDAIIADMKVHSPVYPEIQREGPTGDSHLLVIDPADVHVGKLVVGDGTDNIYDIKTAVARMVEGVNGVIRKALPYNIEHVVLVVGNDILHVDNNAGTTTKGTRQDTYGKIHQMFLAAKQAYIQIIEQLVPLADVTVVFNPSNHDQTSGWMLADSLYSWFYNNPNVHFGQDERCISTAPRKYVVYHNNLLCFTHGDGAKETDLKGIMQHEARAEWGQTKFSYLYAHHFHHKRRTIYPMYGKPVELEKDHPGVTVISTGIAQNHQQAFIAEVVRSPSPPDQWHNLAGYVNFQAIEAFLHHSTGGQVARFTHFF